MQAPLLEPELPLEPEPEELDDELEPLEEPPLEPEELDDPPLGNAPADASAPPTSPAL